MTELDVLGTWKSKVGKIVLVLKPGGKMLFNGDASYIETGKPYRYEIVGNQVKLYSHYMGSQK